MRTGFEEESVGVWKAEPRPDSGLSSSGPLVTPNVLQSRWRTASLASGWRFPSDWSLPEVARVCAAVAEDTGLDTAVRDLGAARAAAGVGLAETLTDLAALHAVLSAPEVADGLVAPCPDAVPSRLVRLTSLGWADAALQPAGAEVRDPLTGLATAPYLRTRLHELYHRARALGAGVTDHVLAVIRPDLTDLPSWARVACMVLIGQVLRTVFRAGETLALTGPSVAAVLTVRNESLRGQLLVVSSLADEQLAADPWLAAAVPVRTDVQTLPPNFHRACDLVADLGR